MLSFLLRSGSFISQEQFCLSNCCRAKMIPVGTHPGDFCPHKPPQSLVLDFLLFLPSKAVGHLHGTGLISSDIVKGSGPEDHSEGAESLVEDEPVDDVPATPACTERFLRCREVAQSGWALGWHAEVIAMPASKNRASQSLSDLGILHWVMERRAGLQGSGLLRERAPPTFLCCCRGEGPRENPANMANSDYCHWKDCWKKDVWRCCVKGYLFLLRGFPWQKLLGMRRLHFHQISVWEM